MKSIIYITFFCGWFVSCDDPEPIAKGINTTVHGKLVDLIDKPVVNAKVKVGEYLFERNYTNGGMDYFQRWIDSLIQMKMVIINLILQQRVMELLIN